jgi:hypothetical protein
MESQGADPPKPLDPASVGLPRRVATGINSVGRPNDVSASRSGGPVARSTGADRSGLLRESQGLFRRLADLAKSISIRASGSAWPRPLAFQRLHWPIFRWVLAIAALAVGVFLLVPFWEPSTSSGSPAV